MSDYINRKELLKNLKQFAPEHLTPLIVMLIEKQPTADVAEIVRCKDCKNARKIVYGYIHCRVDNCIAHKETDFCSYGERMDGDTNDA